MGQKVPPTGLRLGINRDWNSHWYPENKNQFANSLGEDIKIRKIFAPFEKKFLIDRVVIDKTSNEITVTIVSARPGMVTGENGDQIKKFDNQIRKAINKTSKAIHLNVVSIENPNLSAKIIASEIANQLENRMNFRIVQKQAIAKVMRSGAKGIKTLVSGRLNGVDMARSEGYLEGIVPLHTLRADIDYAHVDANTKYGRLGVKIWICRGEILNTKQHDKIVNKENIAKKELIDEKNEQIEVKDTSNKLEQKIAVEKTIENNLIS